MSEPIWGYDNKQWTQIPHNLTIWHRDDLRVWINNNIEGDYRVTASYIYFKEANDATMFVLKYR